MAKRSKEEREEERKKELLRTLKRGPDLDRFIDEQKRNFVSYAQGARMYSIELLLIRETGKRTISKNVSQMTGDKGVSPFSEILSEACGKTGDVRHQTI